MKIQLSVKINQKTVSVSKEINANIIEKAAGQYARWLYVESEIRKLAGDLCNKARGEREKFDI